MLMKSSRLTIDLSAWSFNTRLAFALFLASSLPVAFTIAASAAAQNAQNVLIVSAIALILTFALSHLTVKPIRLLTKAARSVEQGNFAPVALVQASAIPGSIGYLAKVFSKLVARVKAAQEQQISKTVTEVLLQELSTQDLVWLDTTGHYQEVPAGTILWQVGQRMDLFSIVLDGILTATCGDFELYRLHSGEVLGEACMTETNATALTTIKVLEPTLLLSIPHHQLGAKLKQDIGFAARLHRAIALILSKRLQQLLSQVGCTLLTHDQPLRDVLFVLGALNDSDIDWLVATGKRQKILANTVLIQQNGAIDALYILLDGMLSVSTANTVCNPFLRAFSVLDAQDMNMQEITRLAKGEIVGESPFLDVQLPPTTVMAVQDSLVLAIPRSQLASKLHQDPGFATRFYKVLVSLLMNRLQDLYHRLGDIRQPEIPARSLNGFAQTDDGLNFNLLDEMAIASTRFDWLLRRLGSTEPT